MRLKRARPKGTKTPHEWLSTRGRIECRRCGMRATWPGARDNCSAHRSARVVRGGLPVGATPAVEGDAGERSAI